MPSPDELARAAYLVALCTVALPTAIAVVLLAQLLVTMGVTRWAGYGIAAAYGLGTLALPYATLLYGHQLAAALLLIAYAQLARWKYDARQPRLAQAIGAGALLGYSIAVEYPTVIAVLPMTVYAARYAQPKRQLIGLALGIMIPVGLLMIYHWSAFGGPLTTAYEFSTQTHRHQGLFMGLGRPNDAALMHILFTPYRGLFYSAPWLLLGVFGIGLMIARSHYRSDGLLCAAIFLSFAWLNISLVDWQGGFTVGARYLIPAIPFLVVPMAIFWRADGKLSRNGMRWWLRVAGSAAIALMAGYSFWLMLVATAVKPEVPMEITDPFQVLQSAFFMGELALNTQGIDMALNPGFAAPRQAWNLGQIIGLRGISSLLPLWIALTGVGALLIGLIARQRAEGNEGC